MTCKTSNMILDKNNATCFVRPYKASTGSNSLVITLSKFFTDKLGISLESDLIVSLDEENQEISIRKVNAAELRSVKTTQT